MLDSGVLLFILFALLAGYFIGLCMYYGVLGLLKPNPGFWRALLVAVMPLFIPFAILNLFLGCFFGLFYYAVADG
jgi:hypothetical protein